MDTLAACRKQPRGIQGSGGRLDDSRLLAIENAISVAVRISRIRQVNEFGNVYESILVQVSAQVICVVWRQSIEDFPLVRKEVVIGINVRLLRSFAAVIDERF